MHEEKLLEEETPKEEEIRYQSGKIKVMKNFFTQSCDLSKEANRSKICTNASAIQISKNNFNLTYCKVMSLDINDKDCEEELQ